MSYIPDNYDLFKQNEDEQERWLSRRPKCDKCGEPIQDEYAYEIEAGEVWCQSCTDEWLADQRKDIDEMIEKGW